MVRAACLNRRQNFLSRDVENQYNITPYANHGTVEQSCRARYSHAVTLSLFIYTQLNMACILCNRMTRGWQTLNYLVRQVGEFTIVMLVPSHVSSNVVKHHNLSYDPSNYFNLLNQRLALLIHSPYGYVWLAMYEWFLRHYYNHNRSNQSLEN